jgi:hypothetical protein
MILTVFCNICKATLAIVEKDVITQQDQDEYKKICSCDLDGQQDVECSVSEE